MAKNIFVAEVTFNKVTEVLACKFIKKRILIQVFSYEYCEIFKNTYIEEHLRTAASDMCCKS